MSYWSESLSRREKRSRIDGIRTIASTAADDPRRQLKKEERKKEKQMKTTQRVRSSGVLLTTLFGATLFLASRPVLAHSQQMGSAAPIFAQKLVEATQAKHPKADEVGISTVTSRGCVGIASTDRSDVDEKCEKADTEPMHTGKPFVEKESDGFDVSLPLHDSSGKLIGSVGIGFKAAPGQTTSSVTQEAQKIAQDMEAQIPSKASLFRRSH